MTRIGLIALLLAGCTAAPVRNQETSAPAELRTGNEVVSLLPGIVVETDRRAFARGAAGGMLAVDITNGRVLWETDYPYSPILVADDVLVAMAPVEGRANRFQVVWIDADRGEVLRKSEPVALPDWVSVVPAPGRSFRVRGEMSGSELVLDWKAGSFYAGGARPTQAVLDRAKREASGRVAAFSQTGAVEKRREGASPSTTRLPEGLETTESLGYWVGDSWNTRPFVVQDRIAALELEQSADGQTLLLKTWDLGGKALNGTALTTGRNLWVHLTADGRHLLVHDTPRDSAQEGRVYRLPDGAEVVELDELPRPVAMHVSESLILAVVDQRESSETKRRLLALDPGSGEESWSLPLLAPARFPRPR